MNNTHIAIGVGVVVVVGIVYLSTKNKQARAAAFVPSLVSMGITVGNTQGDQSRTATLGAESGALQSSALNQYAPSRHAGMRFDGDETSPTYGQWIPTVQGSGTTVNTTLADRQL